MKNKCYDKINQSPYKLTTQRRAVVELLEQRRGSHLTAEDIYLEVKKREPSIGLATIYRTLELLVSLEVLRRSSFDDGKYRYEFCEDDGHYHHHFICLGCGGIDEVGEDDLQGLENSLEKRGYHVLDHSLKIYGYCPHCRPQD